MLRLADQPLAQRDLRYLRESMPRPSSSTAMMQAVAAATSSAQIDSAFTPAFPGACDSPRGLEPVADGVAQHVHDRILQRLEHDAIGLHLPAGHVQLDRFSFILGQVAHHFPEAVEHVLGGHHARLTHVPLQLAGERPERPGVRCLQLDARRSTCLREQLNLVVEVVHVAAQRLPAPGEESELLEDPRAPTFERVALGGRFRQVLAHVAAADG